MSRAALKIAIEEMEVTDQAVDLLCTLPPNTAFVAALTVAKSLANCSQAEEIKMFQRRNRRPAYRVHSQDTAFLDAELASISSAADVDVVAQLKVLFEGLSPDSAMQVSFNIARWAAHRAKTGGV